MAEQQVPRAGDNVDGRPLSRQVVYIPMGRFPDPERQYWRRRNEMIERHRAEENFFAARDMEQLRRYCEEQLARAYAYVSARMQETRYVVEDLERECHARETELREAAADLVREKSHVACQLQQSEAKVARLEQELARLQGHTAGPAAQAGPAEEAVGEADVSFEFDVDRTLQYPVDV